MKLPNSWCERTWWNRMWVWRFRILFRPVSVCCCFGAEICSVNALNENDPSMFLFMGLFPFCHKERGAYRYDGCTNLIANYYAAISKCSAS